MTVGETLTEARRQASLSVDELSERTRIREAVIRSIEQDDFEACGGDLYVRGYVRAIAGAVGIDAQPLIREFDVVHPGQPDAFRLPPFVAGPDATRFDLPSVSSDPAATTFDLPPVAPDPLTGDRTTAGPVTEDLMAAGYDLGPAPQRAGAGAPRSRRRVFPAAVAAVLLAAAAILGVHLASARTDTGTGTASAAASAQASVPAASAAAPAVASAQASQSAASQASASASASVSASASASASAAAKKAAAGVAALPVTSVTAYGADGPGGGDDPGGAAAAVARHPAVPWSTQWYLSPQFGLLKHGTGLLLDLGHQVTVTSIQAALSAYPGAGVQIRVGNGTAPQNLRPAAAAGNAGGALRLALRHPVAARYVLIWFTQLPPDGAGHYAETVSGVMVSGHR
ncbi:MAG TPA: helix-turn-helix transcriptional regulator [Trebonia sp.]